tara:strand:- start:266 stop:622 length:357 start_codon:yes stop_codon:yes gene_type:complete
MPIAGLTSCAFIDRNMLSCPEVLMTGLDALEQRVEARTGRVTSQEFIKHIASLEESVFAAHPTLAGRTWRFYGAGDLLASTRIDRHEGVQLESVGLLTRCWMRNRAFGGSPGTHHSQR